LPLDARTPFGGGLEPLGVKQKSYFASAGTTFAMRTFASPVVGRTQVPVPPSASAKLASDRCG